MEGPAELNIRDVVIGANASIYYHMDFRKIKGVFYPRSEVQVQEAIAWARERGYDVTPKGGGSGLSGACTGGDRNRVVISSLQMREVLSISKDRGFLDVQPGATPDEINALLTPLKMKFFVTPSSRDIATVGGMINTDGGGNDAWVNGTMRDNTLRVKMVLYNGTPITVDMKGVRCEDQEVESELNRMGMTIQDIAGSHGTLGFVTELRLLIRPIVRETLIGGLAQYRDSNELGNVLYKMVETKSPIRYGEAIVAAHPDVRGDLRPPQLILEFPEDYESDLKTITDFRKLTSDELAKLKDIRLKLPKRNPKKGLQLALFEDYGFYGEGLKSIREGVEGIDDLLKRHRFVPFAKYGHAPSKWYLGNNSPAYGIIMHSREIRPEGITGAEVFKAVTELVGLCEELGITPKPEHKWPYQEKAKNERIQQLREVIGEGFNTFVLQSDCNVVLSSMV
jgi:hypothetical protein